MTALMLVLRQPYRSGADDIVEFPLPERMTEDVAAELMEDVVRDLQPRLLDARIMRRWPEWDTLRVIRVIGGDQEYSGSQLRKHFKKMLKEVQECSTES